MKGASRGPDYLQRLVAQWLAIHSQTGVQSPEDTKLPGDLFG
jgi:hypothetical protein